MDLTKFMAANFAQREAIIDVPELKDFFDKDEKPTWTVRAMTAAELGRAKETASEGMSSLRSLISALSGSDADKASAIREAAGLSDEAVPQDVAQRIEFLVSASVSPQIKGEQRDIAVRLAEHFPTTFYQLTNKILELTGKGSELGKRRPSGKTKESAPS